MSENTESQEAADQSRPLVLHPVQSPTYRDLRVTALVTLRAYEVYCKVFQPQEALVTGHCRGGFGTGELVAFLYARSFPKEEWEQRFHEAMDGMKI